MHLRVLVGRGAYGAEASVVSCARSVTHLRDALPHVLVVSLAPAAEAANLRRTSAPETLKREDQLLGRLERRRTDALLAQVSREIGRVSVNRVNRIRA